MTVYLIHFERPIGSGRFGQAQHYIGFTRGEETLDARMEHHRAGTGARLMHAVTLAGIPWSVARVWVDGSRNFERELKDMHAGNRLCPTCSASALKRKAA